MHIQDQEAVIGESANSSYDMVTNPTMSQSTPALPLAKSSTGRSNALILNSTFTSSLTNLASGPSTSSLSRSKGSNTIQKMKADATGANEASTATIDLLEVRDSLDASLDEVWHIEDVARHLSSKIKRVDRKGRRTNLRRNIKEQIRKEIQEGKFKIGESGGPSRAW